MMGFTWKTVFAISTLLRLQTRLFWQPLLQLRQL
jgi:hypothetical protein